MDIFDTDGVPRIGSRWKKPSFPVPTIATVTDVDPALRLVELKCGRQKAKWPFNLFFDAFEPYEDGR